MLVYFKAPLIWFPYLQNKRFNPSLLPFLHNKDHLFGPKQPNPTPAELLERQRQAKLRLESIRPGLSAIIDVLQSPPMNKQLMYSLLDMVLVELFPELDPNLI